MKGALAIYRRASRSRLFWTVLAAGAAVVVAVTVKFSTILHGLIRLADVGGNVNGTGAAGTGALGAGGAGGSHHRPPRQRKGGPKAPKTPDPCADQQSSYDAAQSQFQRDRQEFHDLTNQRAQLEDGLGKEIGIQNAKVQDLWPKAKWQMNTLTTWAASAVAGWFGAGTSPADFTTQQLQELDQEAQQRNWPDVQAFAEADLELLSMQDNFNTQLNNIDGRLRDLDDAMTKDQANINDAKQALDDCLASQGGSASAGEDVGAAA